MVNTLIENYLCGFVALIHVIFLSLKRKHPALLEKSVVCKPSEQHTMTSYTPTDTRQKELDDALVNYIAGDLLALSTVDRYPGQILTERPYIRDPYVHTNGLNIMFLLKLTICESI